MLSSAGASPPATAGDSLERSSRSARVTWGACVRMGALSHNGSSSGDFVLKAIEALLTLHKVSLVASTCCLISEKWGGLGALHQGWCSKPCISPVW